MTNTAKSHPLHPRAGRTEIYRRIILRVGTQLDAARETRAEIHGCLKCAHRETHERIKLELADPGRCDHCNP